MPGKEAEAEPMWWASAHVGESDEALGSWPQMAKAELLHSLGK